jgi:taurine dioxygenase
MAISARRLTVHIGAEVSGVDLRDPSDAEIKELNDLLIDHLVLFFRDQELTPAQHVALGRRFGDLHLHSVAAAVPEHPEIIVLENDERRPPAIDAWHTDVTMDSEPPMGSILRAVEVPEVGGDTLWADMAAAYDLLDDATKKEIDGLVAFHDYARVFGLGRSEEEQAKMREEHPTVEHPVVRTHPETGRKTLYVNAAFACGIKGMGPLEGQRLLRRLERQAWLPTVQCRFRWLPGSVAFWDNRATQHAASNDFLPQRRVMERVTVVGDRPF